MNKKKIILSIAGSDNTSGAGIQADIKTCQLLRVFCLSVVTVVTSQGQNKVEDYQLESKKVIKSQILSIFSQFKVDAIKIGLLSNVKVAEFIRDYIIKNSIDCPVVIDPVFKSTTGTMFYNKKEYKKIFEIFSSIKPIFTPNKSEVDLLIGNRGYSKMNKILKQLFLTYNSRFIVTGIKKNKKIYDYLIKDNKVIEFKSFKVDTKDTHGTGCVFSTSICVNLAKGFSIENSIEKTKQFLVKRLERSPDLGVKYGPTF